MDKTLTQSGSHKKPAERTCLVSGDILPKAGLLRFVVGPGDVLVADLDGNLPGRGMWVRPQRVLLEEALKRRVFSREHGGAVNVPDGFLDQMESLLRAKSLNLLGLARRAGQVVTGFDQVSGTLAKGKAGAVLAAMDGAEDGRRKIRGKMSASEGQVALIENFTGAELSRAVGKENMVHVLVTPGKFAQQIIRCTDILSELVSANDQGAETGYKVAV